MTTPAPAPAPPRRGLVQNAFHLGVGQVVTTILTMLLSAAIARTLGATDFGLLYLVTSISNFAYVFVDWGHGPYVTREVARHPERSGDLLGTVLVVRVATALIVGSIAVTVTWALGYGTSTAMLAGFMILTMMAPYLGLTYSWIFRGRERMEFDAIIQVVLKFSVLTIAFTALSLGGRLLALISVNAIAGTITFVTAMVIYRRLGFPPLQFTPATARELIRDGASMLAISLAVAVQPYIDANLLFKLSPTNVVGWYGAAWSIGGTLVAPAMILGSTMYPRLSRVAADKAEFSRTLRTGFRPLLLIAVLGAVGAYLFADFAIGLIYSESKFGPAADILKAFTPALLLIYIDMLFGHAILAAGKAGQLARAKIVAVIVTTSVEVVLIPVCQSRFGNGGIGIVLAMACGELVMLTAVVLLMRDSFSPVMAFDFARAMLAGFATILIFHWLPPIHPVLGIPVCIALFGLCAFVVGVVGRADLDLLLPMLKRKSADDAISAS